MLRLIAGPQALRDMADVSVIWALVSVHARLGTSVNSCLEMSVKPWMSTTKFLRSGRRTAADAKIDRLKQNYGVERAERDLQGNLREVQGSTLPQR